MFRLRIPLVRSLRFRLSLSYVVFFSLLLAVVGLFFRQTLSIILDNQMRNLLEEEWGAVKGYLQIHQRQAEWFYDREDQEEAFIVQRLRRVFLLTDDKGEILEASAIYQDIGPNPPAEIRAILASNQPYWSERQDSEGGPYLIRAGVFTDDERRQYFVAVGRSLAANRRTLAELTFDYFLLMPALILATGLLGWLLAGRALAPVTQVARAAERISSSSLNLRLPTRQADDELDHLISTFNTMMERLEASFTQTRQFSTDVSHELRTPLTAVRGQLEVALMTARTVEQYREAIMDSLEDVERLSQTIRALLLLSQAESGQLALQKSVFDLAAVTGDLTDQFQIPAEDKRLRLTAELPASCPFEADRIQIERLVTNLLSNAIKYTPPGGAIAVRLASQEQAVTLEIEDTGAGIPEDHLPHIFDRFYRVPSPDREKGLGLGLSFVAWIVKVHGGSIAVESSQGVGTKFTVTLPNPLEKQPDAALSAAAQGNPAVSTPESAHP